MIVMSPAYACIYLHACIDRCITYSCACFLYTVMTCEYLQEDGRTALLWASEGGHADTVRVLVELGASVEAVDKVNIHAHALAYTCCIKHVSHTRAVSSMCLRQHASAYVQHTSAYVSIFRYKLV